MANQASAYLIYCIVENEKNENLNLETIESLESLELEKVAYKDISAMVKRIDAKIADVNEAGRSVSPLLKEWLVAYQRINITIFRHHSTILPLRFGAMVDNKEDVEDFLAFSYIHIKWALDKVRGKAEFAVCLSWDLNAVLQEISQEKEWLDKAKEGDGSKVEIGRLLFEATVRKKGEIVDSVQRKLSVVSLDSSEGRSVDESAATSTPMSLLLNRSYLIERASEKLFDEAITELAKENKAYLSIKYVGPMPPYSFVPLEFKRGNFELIDEARNRLALPEIASFEEIKASYRRLSLKHHPDKNPDDPHAAELFKRIDDAYKIIEAYCFSFSRDEASKAASGSDDKRSFRFSFRKEDMERVFIVKKS